MCVCVCVCVWHSIGSAPRRDTNLRMVSLEPSGPEPTIFEKNFPEKWPVAKLRGKKFTTSMLFYGKNLHYRVYSLIEIEGVRITLDLTKFLCYDWPLTHKQQNCPLKNEWVGQRNEWVAHKKE